MRKASCFVCDAQFARQGGAMVWGGQTFWPLQCATCGTLFVDPDLALPLDQIESPKEGKDLEAGFRQFRLSLGTQIPSGSVLLVNDPLHQRAQMAFSKEVTQQELSWLSLEDPSKILRDIPRQSSLEAGLALPVDWVVWWHGLEHTRRPLSHLAALRRQTNKGLILGMPPWSRFAFQRKRDLASSIPQHRFLAGPSQLKVIADHLALTLKGPFSPGNLNQSPKRGDKRWVYFLESGAGTP